MFTGIVEAKGKVVRFERKKSSNSLVLNVPAFLSGLKTGSSLAVNGVCLTVVKKRERIFLFNVVRETQKRTALANLKPGDVVNLERPLKWGGRVEGHLVLGHVDGMGTVQKILEKGREKSFFIRCPKGILKPILEKGSVAVEGVSLTVGRIERGGFWVHCIPYTLRSTTLGHLARNARVNLEADILVKWAVKARRDRFKLTTPNRHYKL